MRVQALMTDSFGGRGGIAKFNRDFLTALSLIDSIQSVTLWSRISVEDNSALPQKIQMMKSVLNHKWRYVISILQLPFTGVKNDVTLCGHINLLPLAWYLKKTGVVKKIVLIVHGVEVWERPAGLKALFLTSVDHLISVSEFTRRRMLAWAGIEHLPYSILPNCVDLERFTPGGRDPELVNRYGLQGKKVLLTVARLNAAERYKGIDEVLEIMPELCRKFPEVLYLIVGEGDDRARFGDKAESLGIGQHVVFAGYVAEEEKVDHYRLADVYVMPGRGEGFGIVYLEALACGVPVVAGHGDASDEVAAKIGSDRIVNAAGKLEIMEAVTGFLEKEDTACAVDLSAFTVAGLQNRLEKIISQITGAKGFLRS